MAHYRIKYEGRSGSVGGLIAFLALVTILLGSAAAWITHIVWVIKTLAGPAGITIGQAILGVIGTVFPPIGVVHGVLIWAGAA